MFGIENWDEKFDVSETTVSLCLTHSCTAATGMSQAKRHWLHPSLSLQNNRFVSDGTKVEAEHRELRSALIDHI